MSGRCVDCGTTDQVPADNLCDPCLTARTTRDRTSQGHPASITDVDTLAHLDRITRPNITEAA